MRVLSAFCSILLLLTSCSVKKQNEQAEFSDIAVSDLSGRELSIAHCSRCHGYVEPEVLSKTVWNSVLANMGHRMGIYSGGFRPDSLFEPGTSGMIARNAGIYPEKPVIAREDWQKIIRYYREQAPDTIMAHVREKKITKGLKHFKYRESMISHRPAMTTMVKILSGKEGLVFNDAKGIRNTLTFLTPDLKERKIVPLTATPVQVIEKNSEIYLTSVGRGIFPTNAPTGSMLRMPRSSAGYQSGSMTIGDLQRPVHIAQGDLNNDGLEDVVVCEFGNDTGMLSWFENNGRGGYEKRVLLEKPGAITAIIKDANQDGLPDIYVLMAQGDEGVFLFENKGNGAFDQRRLLTFSPLYGSQYIELADFNKDGYDDIVYVAGDNADKSPILKNYHGVYIFLNDGKSNFAQAYFYPLNGAYKAMVRDFDLDGDLDIAAISFFPDYISYPEESFVYLENKGNLKFADYTFPEAPKGRWMVMDAGDIDNDGDLDLVLGSFVYFIPAGDTTGLGKKWLTDSPSVVVLENTTR